MKINLPKKMRTVVADGKGRCSLEKIPLPEYGEYHALVKVLACGICGTDKKIIKGVLPDFSVYPTLLGHEAVGEVVAVGSKVTGFSIGDRVLCPVIEGALGGIRAGWGGLSEYAVVQDFAALTRGGKGAGTPGFKELCTIQTRVPSAITAVDAAMMITFREVLGGIRDFGICENKTLVVFGLGSVGMCFCKLAELIGCSAIAALDIDAIKLSAAREIGIKRVFNCRDGEYINQILKLQPNGFDFVVDAAGSPEALSMGIPLLAGGGGCIALYGVYPRDYSKLVIDWTKLPNQWTLQMNRASRITDQRAADAAITDWVLNGALRARDFISDVIPFDNVLEGLELFLHNKISKKMVIEMG
jgi:2-desacetyl-2-hydroxyethyl bacteriochlorophyllide A dehydrogenase